jgi:regulator of protease activity HflC (stomatin/prohibitin superfamily)
MAQITSIGMLRHLRSEASSFIVQARRGRVVRAGRGLSFLFLPHASSIAEIPADDRELMISFSCRSADFQDVSAQGVLTYRVADPRTLAERVDFTIDLGTGALRAQPLERLELLFSQLAEQHARGWVARTPLQEVLGTGAERIRERIEAGLEEEAALGELGLEVVSVRVSSVRPLPDLERALEAPARERIQQQADEAAFARRALAVEKERAIQENELKNQIELAKRQEELIGQKGQNARRQAAEESEAARIAAEAKAARSQIEGRAEAERLRARAEAAAHETRTRGDADAAAARARGESEAASLRLAEEVRVASERARLEAVREVPAPALFALAAQAVAGKLDRIEHLSLGDGAMGAALTRLIEAGAKRIGSE